MNPLILASEGSEALKLGLHIEPWQWAAFVGLIVALLLGDLFIFHREAHEVSVRSAAKESAVWIGLGLSFTLVIWGWVLVGWILRAVRSRRAPLGPEPAD